ncbi:unnamed protein product [Fusarium graminearum]|nr:unnamed protein product [Fusarium graminearum]
MNRTTQGRRLVMMSEAVLPEERLQPGLFRPTRISTWPRTPELKELPRPRTAKPRIPNPRTAKPRTAKSRYTTLLPPWHEPTHGNTSRTITIARMYSLPSSLRSLHPHVPSRWSNPSRSIWVT